MTFLKKPCGEWDKIEKIAFIQVIVEVSHDDDGGPDLENNWVGDNYNVVRNNSDSDEEVED